MRRLYLQVYLTIVGSLVLVVLTAGLLWHFVAGFPPDDDEDEDDDEEEQEDREPAVISEPE